MVGWMDDEALHRTLTTGRSTFYSRSRREYWVKGETSGHRQWVREVRLDCDGDTLLVTVDQEGAACHTGDRSCFDARVLPAVVGVRSGLAMSASDGSARPSRSFRQQATGPPGDPGVPAAAGRRRDRDRPLPQARPATARDLPAGVGRAGRLVALLLHRRARGGDPDRARRRGRLDRSRPVRAAERRRPARRAARRPCGCCTRRGPTDCRRSPPGMVGFLGYDAVRRVERLPDGNLDDLDCPSWPSLLASDLAVLDHHDGEVWLVANAINFDDSDERVDEAYADAVARVEAMTELLAGPTPSSVVSAAFGEPDAADPPAAHARAVPGRGRRGGRGDQGGRGVPDRGQPAVRGRHQRRRARHLPGAAADQPEPVHVPAPADRHAGGLRHRRLLAGGAGHGQGRRRPSPTRSPAPSRAARRRHEDAALEAELLADPKERAEHVMLVDLGRNDLGRVCRPGTVEVVEFMEVRRYSHIMHLESTVTGQVADGHSALDVVLAAFPAGTLSGAPKVRAMEIIDELEVSRRGLYGGVVGYLDFAGDADAAIAIRTALLRDGVAYVQAGGGIVADSDPPTEDQESQNKAAAVVRAISVAQSFPARSVSRSSMQLDRSARAALGACCSPAERWLWWPAPSRGGGPSATGVVGQVQRHEATGGLSQALAVGRPRRHVADLGAAGPRAPHRRRLLLACRGRDGRRSACCGSGPAPTRCATQVREVSLADQFALTGDGLAVGLRGGRGCWLLAGAVLGDHQRSAVAGSGGPASSGRRTPPGRRSATDPADVWRALDAGRGPDRRGRPSEAAD